MKQLMTIALLALGSVCYAQQKKPDLAFDSTTMKYIYRETVQVDSVSKAELFERVSQWAALAYNDTKHATRYNDKEAGVIITKGFWDAGMVKRWHSLRIECKDNRYRLTFADLVFKTTLGQQEYEQPAEKLNKKDRQRCAENCKETADALRKSVTVSKAKSDGW